MNGAVELPFPTPADNYRAQLDPTGPCPRCGQPTGATPKQDTPTGATPLRLHYTTLHQKCATP